MTELIRMDRAEAEKLGRLVEVGSTAGWDHGGDVVYEIVPDDQTPVLAARRLLADTECMTARQPFNVCDVHGGDFPMTGSCSARDALVAVVDVDLS